MKQQQGGPTVGDTVTVVRHVRAPQGAVIEARAPVDSAIATLIAPAQMTREGDSVRIAYTIAVWSAGQNDLVLPGIVIVDQRGHVDTLPDSHLALDVASVLPAKPALTIPPVAARPWLVRGDISLLPFAVLVPLTLLVLGALQWFWRRRGPELVTPTNTRLAVPLTDERLDAWVAAGEQRLALEHLDAKLRSNPGAADWRARVADVRFAPSNDNALVELVREGRELSRTQP